ncbi:SAC3 family protein B isoform X2 [Citrus clementina]|uniref:SAC3 family protein B isoform X2 n=1 Tax=Citrus clementina TaxID=85681 RepID=UPI000CECE391|nr:SAC3 family protein B isoform X2 [Citrus x clementina]
MASNNNSGAGFGKASGPSAPPKHVPSFGQFTSRSASPPFPILASAPSPRLPEVVDITRSPPLGGFGSSVPAARPFQASNARPVEPPQRLDNGQRSLFKDYDTPPHRRPSAVMPFVASSNYGTSSTAKTAGLQEPKRTRSPPLLSRDEEFSRNSSQTTNPRLGFSSSTRDDHGKLLGNYCNSLALQDQSRALPLANSFDDERRSMGQVANVQVPKRTRSPPVTSANGLSWDNPQFASNDSKRPALSSSTWDDHAKFLGNYTNSLAQQDQSRALPHANSYDDERSFMGQVATVEGPKQTSAPPITSANGVSPENPHSKRQSNRSNAVFGAPNSQVLQRSVPSSKSAVGATRSNVYPVPKRTRSPPLPSVGQDLQENSNFTQYDAEREMQAKAKRLARFNVELSENVQISPEITDKKVSNSGRGQSVVERQKFVGGHSIESAKDYPNENTLSDNEGLEASSVIIGSCPDMCPESERAERERKGDLDRYERLDGDRNQTTEYLAVKKYNRTAEREANLIRPMPILQKTVGYLLDLLDQPYDERFLGLYNFLWDRMRAIRMDLRMQHIFNQEAITMLEQMIRLHIIAMHELCEYTKGEGFSEGFDAHLNIEQMNKTSVELFQMYDDHRKRGLIISTEKEFRGYYALLKLDKHPGYKVEPAELSLDLAKMTPEIRQTPEVLFARSVARACRTGNFIAFFRLARKASYLQACLMHAHFSKLRTQALASLYSGLQNNQGLPVAHVGRWLGMEEEDIESLLEYHGFSIKEFEEPYMVKEGPFLNSDKDYPTKCSKLVLLKRSGRMVEDISASSQVTPPAEPTKAMQLDNKYKSDIEAIPSVDRKICVPVVEEEMPDSVAISSPKNSIAFRPMIEASMADQQCQDDHQRTGASVFPWVFSAPHSSISRPAKFLTEEKQNGDVLFGISPEKKMFSDMEGSPTQLVARTEALQDRSPSSKRYDYSVGSSLQQGAAIKSVQYEEPQDTHQEGENIKVVQDENNEVMKNYASAKLKLILRLWRRRSLKQKELRKQRQLAANTALNSLSLGPPIRQNSDQPSTCGEFDIDHVMRERSEKHDRSWSRLNVSDAIAGILGRRNPKAKCLCWKIVLCSHACLEGDRQMQRKQISDLAAELWLFSKLKPSEKDDGDVVFASPGLSIWKKWIPSQSGADLTCCFSFVKEMEFNHVNDAVSGASAVLFLVSESIPWKLQKVQLNKLVMSIPSGSCLPLLILSCSYDKEALDPCAVIINELGLSELDKSRVNRFLVKFLVSDQQSSHSDEFFSDEQLREGLRWLASESPLQPVVYCMRTRELILTCLSSALEVLGKSSDYEVSPNHCISAFNEALDQSLVEIVAAAKANPSNWPCPEIALVEDSGDDNFMEDWCFPSLGWNSVGRIESLEHALRDLKLPSFPDDISFLGRGCKMGKEIENQRLQLENLLINYLTLSSKMMAVPLARKEASIMLQRSARLELHNSCYYIVPKWVMIFRRIFSWRLMILNNGAVSSSYVLEQHLVSHTSGDLDKLGLEGTRSSPYVHLSLDEMMGVGCTSHPFQQEITEAGCGPILTQGAQTQSQVHQPAMASNSDDIQDHVNTNSMVEEGERNRSEKNKRTVANDISYVTSKLNNTAGEIAVSPNVTKETDNLSKLFEQCHLVQNTNESKLYFYF